MRRGRTSAGSQPLGHRSQPVQHSFRQRRLPRRKLGRRKFKQRRPQHLNSTTRPSSPPPIQEAGRTSRPTCPIRTIPEQSFPVLPSADLRGVNLAGVHLSTGGFNGLMDQTTVFSIPNPAGGGNIGADLSGSDANLANLPMGTVDFRGVNLSGVNLSNADLSNALFDQFTVFSTGSSGGAGPQPGANLRAPEPTCPTFHSSTPTSAA